MHFHFQLGRPPARGFRCQRKSRADLLHAYSLVLVQPEPDDTNDTLMWLRKFGLVVHLSHIRNVDYVKRVVLHRVRWSSYNENVIFFIWLLHCDSLVMEIATTKRASWLFFWCLILKWNCEPKYLQITCVFLLAGTLWLKNYVIWEVLLRINLYMYINTYTEFTLLKTKTTPNGFRWTTNVSHHPRKIVPQKKWPRCKSYMSITPSRVIHMIWIRVPFQCEHRQTQNERYLWVPLAPHMTIMTMTTQRRAFELAHGNEENRVTEEYAREKEPSVDLLLQESWENVLYYIVYAYVSRAEHTHSLPVSECKCICAVLSSDCVTVNKAESMTIEIYGRQSVAPAGERRMHTSSISRWFVCHLLRRNNNQCASARRALWSPYTK